MEVNSVGGNRITPRTQMICLESLINFIAIKWYLVHLPMAVIEITTSIVIERTCRCAKLLFTLFHSVTQRGSYKEKGQLTLCGKLGLPQLYMILIVNMFSFLSFLFCLFYSSCVLYAQCYKYLWFVNSWLYLRFSLTFA